MTPIPATTKTTNPPRSAPLMAGIADCIEKMEHVLADTLSMYGPPIDAILQHLKVYQGKRLRPALLFLAARAVGHVSESHVILAAAIEMIHTATLVHDDVLDEANQRRHAESMNLRFGNKRSILLGDLLFTHAFHLTSRVDRFACEAIGEATNRVCAGELMQTCEIGNWSLSEKNYYTIIDGKTAALTEASAQLGGHYAGASEFVALRLAKFGLLLGRAFQIADDLLDFSGVEQTTGKTLGTDLLQQKPTLPIIHALSQLQGEDLEKARLRLQNPQFTRLELIDWLNQSGSILYAKRKAEDCLKTARTMLEGLPSSEYRNQLEQLTEWTITRDK